MRMGPAECLSGAPVSDPECIVARGRIQEGLSVSRFRAGIGKNQRQPVRRCAARYYARARARARAFSRGNEREGCE